MFDLALYVCLLAQLNRHLYMLELSFTHAQYLRLAHWNGFSLVCSYAPLVHDVTDVYEIHP